LTEGTLVKGPSVPRFAVTVCAALSVVITALPAAAQDSHSLQDMLLAAVRLGDSAAVRSLLAAGADVAKRGTNGKTAIDVADEASRFDIAD
jgi:ankyrin repeat protein